MLIADGDVLTFLTTKSWQQQQSQNVNNVQVGSCGKNQVCAQEEEEELMGENTDSNLK